MFTTQPVTGERAPFVPGPVVRGNRFPLSSTSDGQPVMEAALDWFTPLTIGVITATPQGSDDPTVDGVTKEIETDTRTSGCIQSGEPESLQIRAEGERARDALILHTSPDFDVPLDTVVRVKGTRYRVMKRNTYITNGFVRYELLEDYEPASS